MQDLIAGRYRVRGPLGEGGSGSVLLCDDLTSGVRVALKLLAEADPARVALLHRELEHLRLARHPHLIDVRDFGFDRRRGRVFYTSRPIAGEPLDAYARGRSFAELLIALGHALDALGHLHAVGFLHGDFKPENVLVSASGEGTLLDLGASTRIGSGEIPAMGSPGYVAPEVLAGAADVRSDLFSVGVTLRTLAKLVRDVPPSLAKLTRRLTALEPKARPADVDEVLTLLGIEPRARPVVVPHAFVGRDAELAFGLELLAGLRRGDGPRVLAIVGGADSGKSALLGEIVARAELGMSVVACDPTQAEPFAPLLRTAELEGPADALGVMDSAAALESAGEPTLLVVDDAHRLHAEGRRVLQGILEGLTPNGRLGVLVAGETPLALPQALGAEIVLGPLGRAALVEWLERTLAPEQLEVVLERARGLPGVARRLATAAASGSLGPDALRELPEQLELDALGNDDLLVLARAAAGDGALADPPSPALEGFFRARGSGWVLSRVVSPGALRARLGDDVWRELNAELAAEHPGSRIGVPATATEAHGLGMYLGHALAAGKGQEVVTRLAGCEAAVERWPQAFAGLCRRTDERHESASVALALARIQLAAGEPERALPRLARALGTRPGAELRAEIRELGGLCYAALGNPRSAMKSLSRSVAESQSSQRRAKIAHALATVYSKQGRNREAREIATAHLADADALSQVDLLCDLAQAASFLGDVAAAREALARAVLLPGVEAGRTRARLAAARGLVALRSGDSEAAGRAYAEMLELAVAHRLDDLVAFAGMNYGAVCHQSGAWAAALEAYSRGLGAARARGLTSLEARCLYNLGVLHFELGQSELGEEELGNALAKAERARLPLIAGSALLVLGEVAARRDALAEARGRFGAAREALASCDAQRELGELDVEESVVALAEGELGRAEALLSDAEGRAEALAADDLRARIGWARGLSRAKRGRADEALVELERALGVAERIHHQLLCVKLTLAAAEVCAGAGAPALGERHRARARELWERLTVGLPEPVRALRAPARPSVAAETDLDWRRVLSIYRRLSTAATPRDVLRETLDAAIELTRAERGFLITIEQKRDERVLRAPVARNMDREALEKPQLKFSRSIAESVIESGEPLVTVDAERDPRFSDKHSVHAMQLRSVLCVPIVASSGVLGSIYLDNRFRTAGFGPRETELVVMCADQAALALEKARLLEDLGARTRALEAERQRVEALMREQADEIRELSQELGRQRESVELDGVVGSSPAMRAVYALVDRVAATDITALVTGESGTGKELVARAIHAKSARAKGPFSAINCGAVPEALLEAELFGYKRGAFTGANADRDGLFVSARGGTVFLDELGEMPASMQVKLLRVLQEHEVKPLGSERALPIDVRVIAATNRDLSSEVAAGRFREDLYYRVAVVQLALPPLRERKDDIPALAAALLSRISGELGRPSPRLATDGLRALLRHAWPGNVRELHNVLARASVLCSGEVITASDLGLSEAKPARGRRTLDAQSLENALRDSGMNAAKAARKLGIGRATLYRWMARTGLDRSALSPEER